ncbi:MAG: ComEC/Rec2 family competence protein, partial [Chitinophagaceae bacterium]
PGAFNFRKYAANKGIHFAIYLKEGSFIKTGSSRNRFITFLNKSRRMILQKFDEFFPEKEVRGIAGALLIGYRGDLEKPLLQEYSDAGVVHVIAISGLHLGLIYVVLVWIFSKIRFLHRLTGVRCWLVLILLWIFALLTGGSASVLRSAVMFSCILIGETYFKKSGTWNVIAASAFLLLVYDPLLLFDAGFLLSYFAVAGIVAWQRPLYHSIFLESKLLRQVWNMASVTIAAQLAAFPLCIYYFHQFPNLFLLTNLLVVPLSTIILFGEVAFLLLSAVPGLNDALAFIIHFLINLMNGFVSWSNKIPFSSTHGIYADLFTTFLTYAAVLCFAIWLLARKRSLAIPGFLFLAMLSIYFFYVDVKALSQRKLVFYYSNKGPVVDFIYGRRSHNINPGSGLPARDIDQIIKPSRTSFRARADSKALLPLIRKHPFGISFMKRRILVVSEPFIIVDSVTPIHADLLLITGNPSVRISEISTSVTPGLVIFDATNSAGKIVQWKRECELLNLPCFSIRDSGALVFSLR